MTQDHERRTTPSGADTRREDVVISRKTFLVEALAIGAGTSAVAAQFGASAQGKEREESPIARHFQSQFNEEAQVAAKYAAFAAQAKIEGYPQTARLFQALAAAEALHAEWLLRLLNGVKRTAENLQAGADYEAYLAKKVLPLEAEQAEREKDGRAEALFGRLVRAGGLHEKILRQAREHILAGRDVEPQPLWVCPECGTVLAGTAPDQCPVCGAPATRLIPIA